MKRKKTYAKKEKRSFWVNINPQHYFFLISLFIMMLFFSTISFGVGVNLEKDTYQIGDVVTFNIDAPSGSYVQIETPSDNYRLLSDPSGSHKFNPRIEGNYKIVIISTGSNIVLSEVNFKVASELENNFEVVGNSDIVSIQDSSDSLTNEGGFIKTDKQSYLLGESVSISMPVPRTKRLEVKQGTSTFVLMGEIQNPMKFYPNTVGEYSILLEDIEGNFHEVIFNVYDSQNQIDSSVIDKPTSTPRMSASKKNVLDDKLVKYVVKNRKSSSSAVSFVESGQNANSSLNLGVVDGLDFSDNLKDVEITLPNGHVKNMNVKGIISVEDISLQIVDVPKGKDINFKGKSNSENEGRSINSIKSFAINIEGDFEEYSFSSIAKGDELYACETWNYDDSYCEGSWSKIKDLTPGEGYEILVSNRSSSMGYAETGVATVNTLKSIYRPGENAELRMVVLDRDGYLVSNADVDLEIIDPKNNSFYFSTDNEIYVLEAGVYATSFDKTLYEGNYQMQVSAIGRNVNNTLNSYFTVRDEFSFDIVRDTPVTIDPWQGPFTSSISLTSFNYSDVFSFTELLPIEFTVSDNGGAEVSFDENYYYLTWNNLLNNSEVSYVANSPLVTPDLYELGPSFVTYGDEIFTEARSWYLAIDPITYYDPTSNIAQGWSTGTGTSYIEIDEGRSPDTTDYIQSFVNSGEISQFGFSSVSETGIESITLFVYTTTGSNAQYTFDLRQGATSVCSNTITPSTGNSWQSCTWNNPTGDLSALSVYFGAPAKNGGGKGTSAVVYTAYIEVDTGNPPPEVTLNSPDIDTIITSNPFNFQFTVVDNFNDPISSCDLYTNISGSWASTSNQTNVANNTLTSFSESPSDGYYEWNVLCDNADKSAFATSNRTVYVNTVSPLIKDSQLNETSLRQNRTVRFSTNLTDHYGIDDALITLKYPNSTRKNFTLNPSGNIYSFDITNTIDPGNYSIELIWANDSLGQVSQNTNAGLWFEVSAIPPQSFTLITPLNETESRELNPTLNWQETTTPDFKNYTILISKNSDFSTTDFKYNTFQITNTTLTVTSAFDANTVYYWKVIAYDVFGNMRNSTDNFVYINDRLSPSVTLNSPDDGDFRTTNPVSFNFTPSDINTIDYCEFYSNTSGLWQIVETNNSITKDVARIFTHSLNEGYSIWNVVCTDLAGNSEFTNPNRTIIFDSTGPNVTLVDPSNLTLVNDTNIVNFTAQAEDTLTNVSSCSLLINGTKEQTINDISEGVNFEYEQFLANGNYTWQVSCVDGNGNVGFSKLRYIDILSVDSDAPVVDLYNPDGSYLDSSTVVLNYSVSDATGIEYCDLFLGGSFDQSETNVINFEHNTFTVTGLTSNYYEWRVECVDNSSESNRGISSTQNFTVDLSDPNVILEYPDESDFLNINVVTYNFTPTDTNLDYCQFYTNESGLFEVVETDNSPTSGLTNTILHNTPDGVFEWNVLCFDLSGRSSFASLNRTLSVDTTPPLYSNINIAPESPVNYSDITYYFNATWNDNFAVDTVTFEHNFSGFDDSVELTDLGNDLYSFTIENLSVGSYQYRWLANDSSGSTNQTNFFVYNVNKATPVLSFTLNGVSDNLTVNQGSSVSFQGSLLTPSTGNLTLLQDSDDIYNESSPLSTNIIYNKPGVYNMSLYYPGSENYLSSYETYFLTISDITEPNVTLTNPENNSFVGTGDVLLSYNVSDQSDITSCSLYINGTFNQSDTSVNQSIENSFTVTINAETSFYWRVECTDNASNTGTSKTRYFTTINTDAIIVTMITDDEYEVGEELDITTDVEDAFGNHLSTNINVSLIYGNATKGWWDPNFPKRKSLILDETQGVDQIGTLAEVNITGLSGITNCNQIRIVNHKTAVATSDLYQIYGGDDSAWCSVAFEVNLSASETGNEDYYVYYGNSSVGSPGSFLDTRTSTRYYANQAAADEGTPTNVANIIGFTDGTSATFTQGGGTGTHSAHGRDLINSTSGSIIYNVDVRYRYAVTQVAASTLWELRYSVNDGVAYSVATSGINTVTKTSSAWYNLTGSYSSLTWSNLNSTRLQARISKSGGGTNVMELYWVEMNVTHSTPPSVTQISMGDNESLISFRTSSTDGSGQDLWLVSSKNFTLGTYTAVGVAARVDYTTDEGFKTFEIIPDITPPNVTLISPLNETVGGRGFYDFNYSVDELNLANCSLYFGIGGAFDRNVTNTSPSDSEVNQFSNVYLDLGYYEWNVNCTDTYNNSDFADSNFTLNITGPDLLITTNDFSYSGTIIEGYNATVLLNISNDGLSDTNNTFVVKFYQGNPADSILIDSVTVTDILTPGDFKEVNISYKLKVGNNLISAVVDEDDVLGDADLSNNEANFTLLVDLYQYHYGNITTDILIGDSAGTSLYKYAGLSNLTGNLFISHSEAQFLFDDLQALTRNIPGSYVNGDFTNLDTVLNSTDFADSIKVEWGGGTDVPIETQTFNFSLTTIQNVPVVNSINNSNFKTGILWDTADDGSNERFDSIDEEDVVFVTKLNYGAVGDYGTYDYEIRVPSLLRDLYVSDNFAFYIEII